MPPANKIEATKLIGPSFFFSLGFLAVTAIILALIPLLNLLAYEFCAVLSLAVSITAGPVAIGVVRRKLKKIVHQGSFPRLIAPTVLVALLANLVSLILPLVIILLNAFRIQNCNIATGFLFFLLLPIATALICTTWGVTIGFVVTKKYMAGLTYSVLWLGLVTYNIWEFWAGPQMDSFNQIIGWIAGPIFDEVVQPNLALLSSRIYGLAWGCLALSCLCLGFNRKKLSALLLVGLSLCLLWMLSASASSLGFDRSMTSVKSVLSAARKTPHFVIHHHPDLGQEEVDLLAKDHEFRLHQIEQLIGEQELPILHSYIFPNSQIKKRLVGAARTQYAKPWNYSIYLNQAGFPHPALKHELTHAVAGVFGSGPFKISASGGLWQNVGLLEGLAVAVEWPARKFDPHTWSAILRRLDKAPNIQSLFDPMGFWSQAANRSYTLAGSFVRYLLTHYPKNLFLKAYHKGSLKDIYPKTEQELITEWQTFLDKLKLSPEAVEAGKVKFSRKSIFKKVCAHEIASLRHQTNKHISKKKYSKAIELLNIILGHLPNDVTTLISMAEVYHLQEDHEKSVKVFKALLERDDIPPARKAQIGDRLGNILASQGKTDEARKYYQLLLAANLNDSSDRLALVKLEALEQQPEGKEILDFLIKPKSKKAILLQLREIAVQKPNWGTVWYLLGRQLYNRKLYQDAIPYLERAGDEGLSHPALAAENIRLLAISHYRANQLEKAAVLLTVLTTYPRDQSERLWTQDWLERIFFER
jgi:tetratricopeptide (TPR) repeat protein